MDKIKKLAIVTCCLDDWGGSEELWAKSIAILLAEDFKHITVFKNRINRQHREYLKLEKQQVKLKELDPKVPLTINMLNQLKNIFGHLGEKLGIHEYAWNKPAKRLFNYLKADRPDLVLISQGMT